MTTKLISITERQVVHIQKQDEVIKFLLNQKGVTNEQESNRGSEKKD